MKCKKCGSENTQVQVVNESTHTDSHGVLWFFLFGWLYVIWMPIKGLAKILIYLAYWVCWGWIALIICNRKKVKYSQPEWLVKLMRKKGKTYNKAVSYAICQDCGHKQRV